jgi:DNA-binding NarL/FixJ family response regulator
MLADDHTLVLEALRKLLESRYDVVGTCCDGRALLESAPSLKPDAVIVDIAMPQLNGLEASRHLKQKMPRIKVIFLTMHHDPELAFEAMRAGASAYVLKDSGSSELFSAIDEALKGRTYVTPRIAPGVQEVFIRGDFERRRCQKALSPRQREVLRLLTEGNTMKETADVLNLRRRTIAFHKYHIMEKLGIKTMGELVQFAVKNRLIVSQEERLPQCRPFVR